MATHQIPPQDDSPDDGVNATYDQMLQMARNEQPSTELEQRVITRLGWQDRLLDGSVAGRSSSETKRLRRGLWLGLAAAAVIALTLVSLQNRGSSNRAPEVAAEPPASPSVVAPAPSPPADPCRLASRADGTQPFIDDFEDGNDSILANEGRRGFWRWVRDTDASGTAPALLPIPRAQGSGTNRMGLHIKGDRLLDWGANIEFSFQPSCYDASAYAGLSFEAKGPGRIYLAPRQIETIPVDNGGLCQKDCYNVHVKKIDLDGSFRTYEVRWNQVDQRGYGRPALDPRRLHSIAFMVRPEDTPYDLWIDQVRFLTQ